MITEVSSSLATYFSLCELGYARAPHQNHPASQRRPSSSLYNFLITLKSDCGASCKRVVQLWTTSYEHFLATSVPDRSKGVLDFVQGCSYDSHTSLYKHSTSCTAAYQHDGFFFTGFLRQEISTQPVIEPVIENQHVQNHARFRRA